MVKGNFKKRGESGKKERKSIREEFQDQILYSTGIKNISPQSIRYLGEKNIIWKRVGGERKLLVVNI